jgi:hypothetical protein
VRNEDLSSCNGDGTDGEKSLRMELVVAQKGCWIHQRPLKGLCEEKESESAEASGHGGSLSEMLMKMRDWGVERMRRTKKKKGSESAGGLGNGRILSERLTRNWAGENVERMKKRNVTRK